MGCGPSTPSGGGDGSAYHAEATVYEAGGNSSDDAERVATVMKGPPHVSKEVAVVIVRIMNKEPAFAAEVEAAKTAAGGATPAVLKIAAEQAAAAVGTIYSMVVSLRKQWIESRGEEHYDKNIYRLPPLVEVFHMEEAETEDGTPGPQKRNAIRLRSKAAEASLRSILSVVLDEWELDVGGKAAGAAKKISTKAFKRLPIAEAGPGVPTMLSEIGALVVAHHRNDPDAEWYCRSTPPRSLSSVINHFYAARNALVTTLVPAILTDVALYDIEAKAQVSAAGPEVLARLAAVAKNPNATPLTPKRIADLTSISSSCGSTVPGSRTLARLSHDQMVACNGSIILYKRTSAAVARAAPKLSAPGVVLPGDVKRKERTIYKSAIKYNGDTTKCHDKIRCTVELQTLRDVAVVAEALAELPEFLIVKVKNRFDPAYDALPIGGYRDLQFSGLIKLDDDDAAAASGGGAAYAWCEVQLNLTRMIALKSGKAEGQAGGAEEGGGKSGGGKSGHDAFNMARAINAFAPELFVHDGEWSNDVAKQVAAGLLLDVDLNTSRMAGGKKEAAEFTKAFGSKECRVRELKMKAMGFGEGAGADIAEALKVNTTLTFIDLGYGELGEGAGAAIAEALKVNTTLTSINLSGNRLGEVGGAAIAEALKVNTTLTFINLGYNMLGEVGGATLAEALKVNTTLTDIDVGDNELGEVGGAAIAEALKVNTTLTSIKLSSNFLREVGGAAIAEALKVNTTLTSINLQDNKLGEVGGAAIGEALKVNTTLTDINLGYNDLGEVGRAAIAEALKVNTTLTDINLGYNKLGDVAGAALAEALKVNTTLTSINLFGNNLGEVAGAAIAEAFKVNTTLTDIDVGRGVGDNDALPAASRKAIEAAVARNAVAAKYGIDALLLKNGAGIATIIKSNTSEFTKLDLAKLQLDDVAGAAIAEALKVNTTLTSINLDNNSLGEVAGAAIAEALKVNTTLTFIELRDNDDLSYETESAIEAAVARNEAAAKYGIDALLLKKDAGAAIATVIKSNSSEFTELVLGSYWLQLDDVAGAAIAEALKVNTTLTSINLERNDLGEVAGAAIAEAMKVNTTLTSINLESNDLGEVAGAAIAEALRVNTTLTDINLGYNKLGDVGGAAIAEALKVNTTLTSINLERTDLGDVGGAAIAEALKVNTTLTSINLDRNKLGDVGGAAIAEALKVNTTLTSINLGYNDLGDVARAAIIEALKVNTTLTSIYFNGERLFYENLPF